MDERPGVGPVAGPIQHLFTLGLPLVVAPVGGDRIAGECYGDGVGRPCVNSRRHDDDEHRREREQQRSSFRWLLIVIAHCCAFLLMPRQLPLARRAGSPAYWRDGPRCVRVTGRRAAETIVSAAGEVRTIGL